MWQAIAISFAKLLVHKLELPWSPISIVLPQNRHFRQQTNKLKLAMSTTESSGHCFRVYLTLIAVPFDSVTRVPPYFYEPKYFFSSPPG